MIKNYSKLLCMAAFALTLGLGTTTTLSVISAGDAVASGGDTCNISCTGEGEQKASGSCACECMEGYEPNDDSSLAAKPNGGTKGCKLKGKIKDCKSDVEGQTKGDGKAKTAAEKVCATKDDKGKPCADATLTADETFDINDSDGALAYVCKGATIKYECKDGKVKTPPNPSWEDPGPVSDPSECP